MSGVYKHGVMWNQSHPQAKLYWRVKEDGKWKWIAAEIKYEGAHDAMVKYISPLTQPQPQADDDD